MNKFEVGKTYATRSIGDSECIIRATIVRRTAKTVTAQTSRGVQTFRVSVSYCGQNEMFRPWGSYSMAPILEANDTKAI